MRSRARWITVGRVFLAEGTENEKVPWWDVAPRVAGIRELVQLEGGEQRRKE